MTKEKLLAVLNKLNSNQVDCLEKLSEKENMSFEELIEIRDSFKITCLQIYHNGFEKEFLGKLTKKNETQLKKIRSYIEKEIFRLAYDKKWERK
ncbi:hypothetical protein [Zobellia nedashkovskayae]|uniref:hypothetical protein n=1 Tax=Zobellia nedashkovskayae TaxID=2779510 RepID=UPI00188D6493|nr:hypothetical protein [Zobellia nedashkovskayae]